MSIISDKLTEALVRALWTERKGGEPDMWPTVWAALCRGTAVRDFPTAFEAVEDARVALRILDHAFRP